MAYRYNRLAASYYAQQHANTSDYNSSYVSFENDCTNFVSQALYAGGWEMVYGLGTDYTTWFADEHVASHSWASAEAFSKYLRVSGRAFPCTRELLSLGDVMQLLNQSGQAAHTMIVSNLDHGECLLSYHTKDRKDIPLSKVMSLATEQIMERPLYWKIMDFIPPVPNRPLPVPRFRV